MLPSLESLRCFEAASLHLSFRAAAGAVALSPAAFGERIRQLEEQLGVALFERTTRRVTLTAAGERLGPQARRALEEAARCLEVASGAPVPFRLTVGTRYELGISWLVPALAGLERLRPEQTLHLSFGDSPELLARLRKGSLDAVVTSARLADVSFEYELLHEEAYALVGAPKLFTRSPLKRPRDAAEHVLLDLHEDLPLFRYLADAQPPGERWDFARTQFLGTIAAVRHRVLEGAGVAVLPRYFIRADLAQGALRQPLPRALLLGDHFRLVWRRGERHGPRLRDLAADLRRLPLR